LFLRTGSEWIAGFCFHKQQGLQAITVRKKLPAHAMFAIGTDVFNIASYRFLTAYSASAARCTLRRKFLAA
jgi:hypothetical protein